MGYFKQLAREIHENADLNFNPSQEELRELARKDEKTTQFGSASYVTKIRSRSAKFTEIVLDEPTEEQRAILEKLKEYLKGRKLSCVQRTMCLTEGKRLQCRTYLTQDFARIPFMWSNLLFDPEEREPDMITIQVPEWPERKMIVAANEFVTFLLGSDYCGECKKSNLRMAMYHMKKNDGGLGLHAGSKLIRVKDRKGNSVEKGFILFGLSGTGKTTLTVHDHNLKEEDGEGVHIRQDDIVLMRPDGYCYGTEKGFYIKTEGLEPSQTVLYNATIKPTAILENIAVNGDGNVDFMNYDLTSNGRAVIRRADIPQCDESIDLPKAHVIIFITRRNDIVPPVAKLSPAQGAAAFMLGESIETSAGDPAKAGQSKRCVGTNPFIVGPLHEEGNRFLEILLANPDMECYLLNTGRVGKKEGFEGDKLTIKDSTTIMEQIARNGIEWTLDREWGYLIPKAIEGVESKKLNPANYYSPEEYKALNEKLREERKAWLGKFTGLKEEIRQ